MPYYILTKLRPTRRPSPAIQSRMAMSTSSRLPAGFRYHHDSRLRNHGRERVEIETILV
jgi:hypothetical protein